MIEEKHKTYVTICSTKRNSVLSGTVTFSMYVHIKPVWTYIFYLYNQISRWLISHMFDQIILSKSYNQNLYLWYTVFLCPIQRYSCVCFFFLSFFLSMTNKLPRWNDKRGRNEKLLNINEGWKCFGRYKL